MTAQNDLLPLTAASAGTWQLGDRTVNRLGFGAMRLTGMPWDPKPRDRDAAIAVLRRAVELGVNHIDTAAFYFLGIRSANELIATAVQPYDEDIVLTIKVGPSRSREGEFEPYARPEQLRAQVEENIRQLGVERLDVVNLRWGSGLGKDDGSIADHLSALMDLRDEGLLGGIGVSNVSAAQLTEALQIAPVICVQNRYSLTERADDEVLDLARTHGIAFVPFFAMGAAIPGALPGESHDETGAVEVNAVAEAHGATSAQIRLAWTLHRGPNVLAIPGTGDLRHLEENVAAGAIRLTAEELTLLDAVARQG